LGNHDRHRIATRFGADRSDLLNILLQTLPGVAITYQGEELAMENSYVSWEDSVDPMACNSDPKIYEMVSRDPVRTPFPWDDSKNAGFSTGDTTWLPVGTNYKTVNVKAQEVADNSHLKIFRRLTSIRKQAVFMNGTYSGFLSNSNNVYSYKRQQGDEIAIIVLNFGTSEEIVDLTALFPMAPNQLKVYTSSMNSGLANG
jgi:alpha-glucosidase